MASLPGVFRPPLIRDIDAMYALIQYWANKDQMLVRHPNELCENIRDFMVYEEDGKILGLCGLHVIWKDLAEIRALAVSPEHFGRDIGGRLVRLLTDEARRLGIAKVFTLTYVPGFFQKLGFQVVEKSALPHKIWVDCVRCHKFPDCDETGMIFIVDPA